MRLYSFVNYYLSALQHGLQTAHCTSELAVESNWSMTSEQSNAFRDWATNHKTIIICKGGNHAMLEALFLELLTFSSLKLPTTKFNEDEQSLNGACTAVAIVVPERFYEVEVQHYPEAMQDPSWKYTDSKGVVHMYRPGSVEHTFVSRLKSFHLA